MPIYDYIKSLNLIDSRELYRVFNMGVGFVLVVSHELANDVVNYLNLIGEDASVIGEVTDKEMVRIKGVDF